MSKQSSGRLVGGSALALVLAGSLVFWFWPEDDSQRRLNTATAEVTDIEVVVTATGRLQPLDFVEVGAQVSGQLESLNFEVGEEVTEGELLAQIDPVVLEAQLDGTRAHLEYQRAQLDERQAQQELAEINLQRQQRLYEDEAISIEQLQTAEANARADQARVAQIEAQIEQTTSSLRADEANLNYTRIFAPMSGTIVEVQARRGQTLNAAQTTPPVMTIADLSVMRVQAQVSEADIGRLEPGMPVYFTTMGERGRRWYGELHRIEPTPEVENNVVLYNALFDISNEEGRLLPEMTAQVYFITDQVQDVVAVPAAAVERRGPQQGVVQVLRDGRAEPVEVELGLSDRVQVEIKSGLNAGDEVILPRQSQPRNGPQRPAGR